MKKSIIGAYFTTDQDNDKAYAQAQITRYNLSYTSTVYYPYGYFAKAPAETQAILLHLEGKQDNAVALPYEPKTQFRDLENGEVIVGNQTSEVYIKFNNDGSVNIKATADVNIDCKDININCKDININCENANINASSKVNLETPQADISGNLTVDGNIIGANITATGELADPSGTLQAFRDEYDGHIHIAPDGGGATSTPQ